ncbi:hypothetical protein [Neolewinella persica]|uniref:hypothetical protein n=1 Tax=Neolewinella persica TaxID=70998 RepID=UPI000370A839|nr:hypothetical protein [Neolewinella persica]
MSFLKNILCTCGPALLLFCSLHGQAQDDLYHLLRFHLVPGQEQTFINANADHDANNRSRSAQPRHTYVYSNNTVEVAVPTRELTDTESGQTNQVAELDWTPFADWTETRDPKTLASLLAAYQEYRLRRRADLSYAPAVPTKTEPAPYYEIVTYRARPGQLEKVLEMSSQYAAQMREVKSPLSFDFYTYDLGDAVETFEIAFPAKDPDDLAERRAVHHANLPEAVKRLRAELSLYVNEVRTITGRYVAELSTSGSLQLNAKR